MLSSNLCMLNLTFFLRLDKLKFRTFTFNLCLVFCFLFRQESRLREIFMCISHNLLISLKPACGAAAAGPNLLGHANKTDSLPLARLTLVSFTCHLINLVLDG